MNAKEKAKQLVEKYDSALTYLESKSKAKECALIAVNEIISALVGLGSISYWEEVKKEINKTKQR